MESLTASGTAVGGQPTSVLFVAPCNEPAGDDTYQNDYGSPDHAGGSCTHTDDASIRCSDEGDAQGDWYIYLPAIEGGSCEDDGEVECEWEYLPDEYGAGAADSPKPACIPGEGTFRLVAERWSDADGDDEGWARLAPVLLDGDDFPERAWLRQVEVTSWGDAANLYILKHGFLTSVVSDQVVTIYTRLAALLAYARAFFLTDMGVVHAVEANELVSAEFVADLHVVSERTGLTAVNALLYSFVSSVVLETRPMDAALELDIAQFAPKARRLELGPHGVVGDLGAAVLVHEVRHHWVRHTKCGEYTCDPDISGASGDELSTTLLMWKYAVFADSTGNGFRGDWESRIVDELMTKRIASFQSEPGVLLPEWEDVDLADY